MKTLKEISICFTGVMLLIAFMMTYFFSGCVTTGQVNTVFSQPCSIYADAGATPENSLICAKISNPCGAQKLLATAAKAPVIWGNKSYCQLFDKWAEKIETILKTGVTYQSLQEIVLVQIAKLNAQAGMALLILSDGIFMFSESELIRPMDKKLLLMSLADLRAQVARMAIIA